MSVDELVADDRAFIQQTSIATFMRERILGGVCRVLESAQQARVRQAVAEHFEIHVNHVIIVGSAKLGYSVSPKKSFKPFDDKSDLDVAIVNNALFEKYWLEMYKAKKSMIEWPELSQAQKYLFQGWIRPDKLPLLNIRNSWFDFFAGLQSRDGCGPYPVRGGLYYNHDFLELYQENGVAKTFEGSA